MNLFNKIEKKFGKYAIKNLMTYIIILYAVGFIINLFAPGVYSEFFSLNFDKIFHGEVWRLVTFIIQPPSDSILFVIFALYFYYLIGTVLEQIWGSFKFNVYFFSGVLLNIIASLIIYLIWGLNFNLSTHYINLALFMAFAYEQPDMQVLFMFVLPIKIKWLAIIDAAIFGVTIVFGYLIALFPAQLLTVWQGLYYAGILSGSIIGCLANSTAALVSMLNFLFYFFIFKRRPGKNSTQKNFNKAMRTAKKAQKNNMEHMNSQVHKESFNERFYNANSEKSTWQSANQPYRATKHRCAVCGRTEADAPDLTFRFCTKCKGNYEYCSDHIYTHTHVE
ncbi:MAG: hypothetical protein ACI4E1_03790 [Lachnospira sp.]